MGLRSADLSADLRERYEERAAIIEFEAGIPRRAAEAMAMQEVLATQELIAESQGRMDVATACARRP